MKRWHESDRDPTFPSRNRVEPRTRPTGAHPCLRTDRTRPGDLCERSEPGWWSGRWRLLYQRYYQVIYVRSEPRWWSGRWRFLCWTSLSENLTEITKLTKHHHHNTTARNDIPEIRGGAVTAYNLYGVEL